MLRESIMKTGHRLIFLGIILFLSSCVGPRQAKRAARVSLGEEKLVESYPSQKPLWVTDWGRFLRERKNEYKGFIPFRGVAENYSDEAVAENIAYRDAASKIAQYLNNRISVEYRGVTKVNQLASEIINPEVIETKVVSSESKAVVNRLFTSNVYVEAWKRYTPEGWKRFYKVWVLTLYPEEEVENYRKTLQAKIDTLIATMLKAYKTGLELVNKGKIMPGLNILLTGYETARRVGWRAEKFGINFDRKINSILYGIDLQSLKSNQWDLGKKNNAKVGAKVVFGNNIPVQGFRIRFKVIEGSGRVSPDIVSTNKEGIAYSNLTVSPSYSGKIKLMVKPYIGNDLEEELKAFPSLLDGLYSLKNKSLVLVYSHKKEQAFFMVKTDGSELSQRVLEVIQKKLGSWMVINPERWEYQLTISSRETEKDKDYWGTLFHQVSIKVRVTISKRGKGEVLQRSYEVVKSAGSVSIAKKKALEEIKRNVSLDVGGWKL